LLPKRLRLSKEKEIKETLKKRTKNKSGTLLSIVSTPNKYPGPKFAVITKKALGKANERNYLKRKIKSAILNIAYKNAENVVIYPKNAVKTAKNSDIRQELLNLLGSK
jgi:ribonuclease P protein component